jgi:hypothetical protein
VNRFSWTDLERVFHEVLELAPEKRQAFLDEHCADRPDLRAEIESLLRAHERVDATVDLPPPARPLLQTVVGVLPDAARVIGRANMWTLSTGRFPPVASPVHHVRTVSTANSAVSWLMPTLTHASFFCRSYTP